MARTSVKDKKDAEIPKQCDLDDRSDGITELPFGAFVGIMQPIHLAIGLIEGLITSAVLVFVYEARPELLMDVDTGDSAVQSKCSLKTTIVILAVVVAIVGVGCGALTVLIRVFGGFPEGVSFAILIMNCCAWMFDKHTQRRQFGVSREDVKAKKAAAKAAKKEAKEAAANG